ncbi:MAG: O-antigen ligase family protein [Planctomycetaceae bacterium]
MRGWIDSLATVLTGAIVLCRLLTPAEGVVAGENLWIAQLSLCALLIAILAAYQAGEARWRVDLADACVFVLLASHAASAIGNWSQLDLRAACNLVCEWSGLAATWVLLRRSLERGLGARQMLLVHLAAGLALGGLGIWQHFVEIPETRRMVEAWDRESHRLEGEAPATDARGAAEQRRALARLRRQAAEMGMPVSEGERQAWLDRVTHSSEPYGFFALANTFAGVLLCALLLSISALVALWRGGRSKRALAAGAAVALLAYVLLLTKSRTAFVGLIAGGGLVAVLALAWPLRRRSVLLWCGVGLALMLALGALAALTGGLDRLVFSQSLKSLRYRGEYWRGTWAMMTADMWRSVTGAGPGNFQSTYLQFKVPESSESIADPHNLALDVWANAGLAGVVGLVALCAAGLRPVWRPMAAGSGPERSSGAQEAALPRAIPSKAKTRKNRSASRSLPFRIDPLFVGGALAFAFTYFVGGGLDARLPGVALGWIAATAFWQWLLSVELPPTAAAIALTGLLVHLLGAGGIEMPAIVQTVLYLVAWSTVVSPLSSGLGFVVGRRAIALAGLGALALFLAVWHWGLSPVVSAQAHLLHGDALLAESQSFESVEREYRGAATADPLGHEAYERLAGLWFRRWEGGSGGQDRAEPGRDAFEQIIYWSRRAIERFPRNIAARRIIAEAYQARWKSTHDSADARRAADAFEEAVELYPNHSGLQAECALALWSAEEPASAQVFAARALELDEINQALGHRDKLLPVARVNRLRRIVSGDEA